VVGEFGGEGVEDGGGDELADIAVESGDFLDDAGAEVGVFFVWHEEDGFDVGIEVAVHESHLEFEFEIGDGAQAADDGAGVDFLSEVDEQAVEVGDLDLFQIGGGVADEVEAFFGGEEGGFCVIAGDGDSDVVEEAAGAFDDVEVAVGDWVEGARIDGALHDQEVYTFGWENGRVERGGNGGNGESWVVMGRESGGVGFL